MSETEPIKRFVALYDQHYPYCIPAFVDIENPKRSTPVLRFLRDFDPSIVIHGGDQLDLDAIAYWNDGKPRLKENSRLAKDYEGYNLVLDAVEKATPHAKKVVMMEGNHEARIQNTLDEKPEFEGLIEVPKNLRIRQRGYQWIQQRGVANFGKLFFIHGDYKSGVLPLNHSRQILQIYHRNVVYGHCHTNQSATSVSPIDTHPYQAQCVGTLAHLNPAWRKNDVSSWVNSFACGYIHPNGNFNLYVINIIDGAFTFDGVTYKQGK